jgi:hypothetical protein
MELKSNLHFHTGDDPEDPIPYSLKQAIDTASEKGFSVLGITCHNKFTGADCIEYAVKKGILIIPGIEKTVENVHIVILNANIEAEKIKNFNDLEEYKNQNPNIFLLAPHPFFPAKYALNKKLLRHIEFFDAIEKSWFYSKKVDFNKKSESVARENNLPYIATSDTHRLRFLESSYAIINSESKTIDAIFDAIRKKRFINVSKEMRFWKDMVYCHTEVQTQFLLHSAKKIFLKEKNKILS